LSDAANNSRLTQVLLVGGAVIGLGAAMWSALGVDDALTKYGDAIATVDGVPIPRSVFDSAIEGLASAKRNPLSEAEKREALERIVDEELLLRRALKLGLAESDPASRKALVNAMLQFSIADTAKLKPTDDELRKFYVDRPKLIAPQPLLTVRAVSFDNTQANQIAAMKAAVDAGRGFDAGVKETRAELVLLPTGPVVPAKVAEYAGGTIRDTALAMNKGETAGPIEIGRRVVFVHVAERTEAPPPPFESVRDVVTEEWQKRASEQAFSDYVEGLRSSARVTYDAGAPKADAK
jgi:hypothetical protein